MPEEHEAFLEGDPEFMTVFNSLTDSEKRILSFALLGYKSLRKKIVKQLLVLKTSKKEMTTHG